MKLNIANITIRQDAEGRYSLADLHQASGSNPNHRPSNWLRSQRTKNLIAALESKAQIRALPIAESQSRNSWFDLKFD